jgi:predicted ATPase/DNA-binding SARP family transcriptional activator
VRSGARAQGSTIEIQLLGEFVLRHGQAEPAPWRRAAPRRLFKLLLVAKAHTLNVDQISAAFWPGEWGDQVRQRLHHLAYLLRTALDEVSNLLPPSVARLGAELRDNTLRLTGVESLRIDVQCFDAALVAALAAPLDGSAGGLHALQAALAWYRGPLLPGERAGEAANDWLRPMREHLARRFLHGMHTLAQGQQQAGLGREAIDTLSRVLAIEPADELAHRELMSAYGELGQRSQVERQYADCKAALSQAMGVPPSAATQQAYRRAMLGAERAERAEGVEGEVGAGGAERLPVSNGPADAAAAGGARFKPPLPLVTLIDRDPLVADIMSRLRSPQVRQVTLLGAGGLGKTQLALRVAHEMAPTLPHGACFVALDEVGPDGVLDRLRRALRLHDDAAQDALAAVGSLLEDKTLLLVLDNCEHVTDSLGFITPLLAQCAGLQVLATSRRPLNLLAEQLLHVPGLNATPASGMRLFVERARAAAPGFAAEAVPAEVLAAITQRLDGVPLSIELVAARVRAFTPGELLRQLDEGFDAVSGGGPDRPPRHRSLEASFAWSRALLAPSARHALDQAVLFQAPFQIAALAAVCEVPAARMADQVQTLVELGLARRADEVQVPMGESPGDRFHLHASARSFLLDAQAGARPQRASTLEPNPEPSPEATRFVAWFAALAGELDAQLAGAGADAAQAMAGLEADHENFFAALQLALQANDCAALVTLVRRQARYWSRRGAWSRADAWVERALSCADSLDHEARLALWLQISSYWIDSHRDDLAMVLLQSTMVLAQAQADVASHAQAAISFAGLACQRGEGALAIESLQSALVRAEAAGRADLMLSARNNLAYCWLTMGRIGLAKATWLDCEQHYPADSMQARVSPAFNLALVAHYCGQPDQAARLMAEAQQFERQGAPRPARLAQILVRKTWMHCCDGDAALAAQSLQAARAVAAAASLRAWQQVCDAQGGKLALVRGEAAVSVAVLERCLLPGRGPIPTWDLLDLQMWLIHAHLSLPDGAARALAVLADLVRAMGAGWLHEAPRVLELASACFARDGRFDAGLRARTQAQALRREQGTRRFAFHSALARRTGVSLKAQDSKDKAARATARASAPGEGTSTQGLFAHDMTHPLAWLALALR